MNARRGAWPCALVAACGSAVAPAPPRARDAAVPLDDASPPRVDAATVPEPGFGVMEVAVLAPAPTPRSGATALFATLAPGAHWTEARVAAQCVRRSLAQASDAGAAVRTQRADAVEVADDRGVLSLAPNSGGGYDAEELDVRWHAGEAITLRVHGGAVPAFERTLRVPAAPALRPLDVRTDGPDEIVLDRARELPLAWAPLESDVVARVTVLDATSAELACTFRGADGAGVIPAAALASLPRTPPEGATLVVDGVTEERFTVATYALTARAVARAFGSFAELQ